MFRRDPSGGPPHEIGCRTLPSDVAVLDVADRCREAGLAFLSGSNGVWSMRDLAAWLAGPYRAATVPAPGPPTRTFALPSHLDEAAVIALVVRAREAVLEMLSSRMSAWEGGALAAQMTARGLLVAVKDSLGIVGCAPVGLREARLADRVASLFVADYFVRPGDYESIVVCDGCGEVSFAWARRHQQHCPNSVSQSGPAPKYADNAPPRKLEGRGC